MSSPLWWPRCTRLLASCMPFRETATCKAAAADGVPRLGPASGVVPLFRLSPWPGKTVWRTLARACRCRRLRPKPGQPATAGICVRRIVPTTNPRRVSCGRRSWTRRPGCRPCQRPGWNSSTRCHGAGTGRDRIGCRTVPRRLGQPAPGPIHRWLPPGRPRRTPRLSRGWVSTSAPAFPSRRK